MCAVRVSINVGLCAVDMTKGIIFRSSAKRRRLIFSWENVSQLTPQTKAAATAWDMVNGASEKFAEYKQSKKQASDNNDEPLIPPGKNTPGGKFGGFGFGKQGEKAAGLRGYTISKPVESLPREYVDTSVADSVRLRYSSPSFGRVSFL